jgi:gluconate 2-dehydrogenase gamma chain
MKGPTRREIVVAAVSAGVSGASAWLLGQRGARTLGASVAPTLALDSTHVTAPESLRVLSATEYAALVALCERIYPRDETPGAADLRIPQFIDRALASTPLPGWADGFLTGLARLDLGSFRRFGQPFPEARVADQEALVAQWAGESDGDNPQFVRSVIAATLEGALGDPTYGGNADGQGWKAFGFRPDPFSPSLAKPK